MNSKADLLKEITRLTGRTLNAEQWTIQELNGLRNAAETALLPENGLVQIPLAITRPLLDPRLELLEYKKLLFAGSDREERIRAAGLRYSPLNLVLSLEGTLLSIIDESPSATLASLQANPSIRPLCESLNSAVIPTSLKTILIAVRPKATEFLTKLRAIGRLFLISKLPHKVVQAALTTTSWTSFFEDIICSSDQFSINSCFPRLSDSRNLTLIFSSNLELWDAIDQKSVIPSKRYLALERASSLGTLRLNFYIDAERKHVEILSPSAYSLFEVDPHSTQLLHVADLLESIAFELFSKQYLCDAWAVLSRQKSPPRTRAYVDISNLSLRLEAIAIAKAVGIPIVDLLSQASMLIVDRLEVGSRQERLEGQNEHWEGLVQRYFNVRGK